MELINQYKSILKQSIIDNQPTNYDPSPDFIKYKDRANYTFTHHYKQKYHFSEIFNRIICQESNKPSQDEIKLIQIKLNNDFTLNNIYNNTTYNQRKHLIYIYHILNKKPIPIMTSEIS